MRVLISGSTGFIGTALVKRLLELGHEPVRLVRSTSPDDVASVRWDPAAETIDDGALDNIDAVVHLAGESIASSRWTARRRPDHGFAGEGHPNTRQGNGCRREPAGDFPERLGDRLLRRYRRSAHYRGEPAADDFAALVTVAGSRRRLRSPHPHSPRLPAHRHRARPSGGALKEQLPFFKLGIGGRIGDGTQWFSWISLDDEVGAIIHLLENDVSGPVNLTAPNPVTNGAFTKALGRVLGRPTLLPTPTPALYLRLGKELAQTLLLGGSPCHPPCSKRAATSSPTRS